MTPSSERTAADLARQVARAPHRDDWAPHAGPQERFLRLSCFEALYGGAAGGGKSDALLVDALREVGRGHGANYRAILFRRTFPDLERSLIRRSLELYPRLGGEFNAGKFVWRFPAGETVSFGHMAHENDALNYKSAEFQFVGFDELTTFTEFQYTYLFSRVRSSAGVPCRVRAASNPGDVGHAWVRQRFFAWVSRKAPHPARPAEVRYFVRRGETDVQVEKGTPGALGRTFVPARLADNPTLTASDPGYAARLDALPVLEKARLKGGDWDAAPSRKDFYDRAKVRPLPCRLPAEQVAARARSWDFGGTTTGDFSAGVLMAYTVEGLPITEHVVHFQGAPDALHAQFALWSARDLEQDPRTVQTIPLDPGAAGLIVVADFQRRYPGITIRARRPSGDKATRFGPFSSRALAGNAAVVDDGSWDVEGYHQELESFPLGANDDRVDATSDGYAEVTGNVPADYEGWAKALGEGLVRSEAAPSRGGFWDALDDDAQRDDGHGRD